MNLSKTSIFKLVSVAKETGLSLTLKETPEDRFCCDEAHMDIQLWKGEESYNDPVTTIGLKFTCLAHGN